MSDRTRVGKARRIPSWLDVKRVLEALAALAALVLLAPLFLVVIVAIKLDSPGPVFFRVRRVGYLGRELSMLKFRKMRDGAGGAPLTIQGDPRLTRVGRVLACCRLDELPQLWHVLRGEMSIVGPRPEDPRFVSMHPEQYRTILSVRPGITGLSQIAYKEEASIVDDERLIEDYLGRIMPQKLVLDTLYATGSTLRLDFSIAVWTLITMLLRTPVSVNRRTARMNFRRRPSAEVVRLPVLAAAPRRKLAMATAGSTAGQSSGSQIIGGRGTGDSGRMATAALLSQSCPDGAS